MPIQYEEIKNSGQNEILYTHVMPGGSAVLTFALSRLRKSVKIKMLPLIPVPVNMEAGVKILEQGLADWVQLNILMKQDPKTFEPMLMIAHADGSSSIIDGMESYCACVAKRVPTVLGRRIPFSLWTEFTVHGVPYTDAQFKLLLERRELQLPSLH